MTSVGRQRLGGPSSPATPKGEATRGFLLRVAAGVFAGRGYANTTLNELIEASGLTKGAFYFHFRSKSELALAVLRDQDARWLARIEDEVLGGGRAVDQLRALIPVMLQLLAAEPGAWSIVRLTRDLAAEPALAEQVAKPMAEWVRLVGDIVRRGQLDGDLRPELDPDHVGAVLVGAFDGLKSLVDVLEPGERCATVFAERAQTLLTLVEAALVIRR
ncbi:MAG: TetR family transcriptional regulator [Actinobacteria bacterium]|nr:TetR family transcriptional regulator [Actinomycetota bacterium]